MKIGLLECDHVSEAYRHIAGGYPAMFADLLGRYAPLLSLESFDVRNGELPGAPDTCDGYICTGSRYSVYDDAGWIQALKGFVRQLYSAGVPFVGICFGHQMLAEALGGEVSRAEGGWGVGIHEVDILRSELWMQPQQSKCRLQFMHQDQVRRLPEDGVLLGRSDHCPIAMFRLGERMIGIQGHPEFTRAYTEALLADRIERIGADRVASALSSLSQATDEGLIAGWIAEFLTLKFLLNTKKS
jgi:GMP synthase-like glutamine amidotransferase